MLSEEYDSTLKAVKSLQITPFSKTIMSMLLKNVKNENVKNKNLVQTHTTLQGKLDLNAECLHKKCKCGPKYPHRYK